MSSNWEQSHNRPRILFVDAFDSFTNNIIGLLEQCLEADVTLIRIDNIEADHDLPRFLHKFDAVVVGPGPGHPANGDDVGFVSKIWKLEDAYIRPVLGICLGFQSLCYSQGASIRKLSNPRHGIVTRVSHSNIDIFTDVGECDAVQYNSLVVDIGKDTADGPLVGRSLWEPSNSCQNLVPLAWSLGDDKNGPVLMSVRHASKPLWGVQFHPESVCTSRSGRLIIENWWSLVSKWLSQNSQRHIQFEASGSLDSETSLHDDTTQNSSRSTNGAHGCTERHCYLGNHFPIANPIAYFPNERGSSGDQAQTTRSGKPTLDTTVDPSPADELRNLTMNEQVSVLWTECPLPSGQVTDIVEALCHHRDEAVFLDSQDHSSGRWSILGLVTPGKTLKVTYRVWDRTLRYGFDDFSAKALRVESIDQIWPILRESLDLHNPRGSFRYIQQPTPGMPSIRSSERGCDVHCPPEDIPFWGGFMGYVSYEAGLDSIDVKLHPSCEDATVPDVNLAFIHRSIVIDHHTSQAYVQSLLPEDETWVSTTSTSIEEIAVRQSSSTRPEVYAAFNSTLAKAYVTKPAEPAYRAKVRECQEYLRSGNSYELCLTDSTTISLPMVSNGFGCVDSTDATVDEWTLYKRLRVNNPAPHGAFMRLSGATVVGNSPERFLRWTRSGQIQFRPIKGTVKKGPGMTPNMAHGILNSSKERAENLMIVDLIRHDLSGVTGAARTWVSKLMVVEEYENVYQLVSVIEGQLPPSSDPNGTRCPAGIDVLRASLPPGSMTGAPKKRSCEILRDIEQRPRSIYSGILGFMDVGGGGDFSVVIRTMFRDHRSTTDEASRWCLGAGGAVTIQSTDKGEFDEMETKASSVLRALFSKEKM